MSKKRESEADENQDLDETIERQMNTTGVTGVMRTLSEHAAAEEGADDEAEGDDEEFRDTVVIPPDALP